MSGPLKPTVMQSGFRSTCSTEKLWSRYALFYLIHVPHWTLFMGFSRAEFPVSPSSHVGFTPRLLYSSTHHSPESFTHLKAGWAQDSWLYWLHGNWYCHLDMSSWPYLYNIIKTLSKVWSGTRASRHAPRKCPLSLALFLSFFLSFHPTDWLSSESWN